MPATPTDDEKREMLREIGLTRLARSADLPKYHPNITHSIYDDVYRTSYGDQSPVDYLPSDDEYQQILAYHDRRLSDIIVLCDEYFEAHEGISKWHYTYLVKQGKKIQESAKATSSREQVGKYIEVVERVIGYMDKGKKWSSRLVDTMEKEVLVAYWLKAKEIDKRWPKEIAALGLSRLTLEDN